MSPVEAAQLLTLAAAFDNRKPDADTARVWALALDGLRVEDCSEAIVTHGRTSTDYLTPAHIVTAVRRVRAKRIAEAGDLCPPAGLTESEEREWLAHERRRIGDGHPPSPDHTRRLETRRGGLRSLVAPRAVRSTTVAPGATHDTNGPQSRRGGTS